MGSYCEKTMFHPVAYDKDHEFEVLPKWGHDIRVFDGKVEHREFEVEVPNGYTLRGEIIPADPSPAFPDGRRRVVILVHGRTANRYTTYSYGEAYHKLGFDLVCYDQRAHGISGGEDCSMGFFEAQDLIFMAGKIREMFPEGSIFGIHGESMGAATVMMAGPDIPFISFVCEDAGYGTLRDEFSASLKYKAKLPGFPIANVAIWFTDRRCAFKVDDVRPIDGVKRTKVPMLFIHGGQDRFVPTENCRLLFDAKQGAKAMHIFEDVPHAKSALVHQDEYTEMLRSFLSENKII